MASENDLVNKLVALLSGFDDGAWAALTSVGLLRRARKDLEKGVPVEIVGHEGEALKIKVPPFVVSIPSSGPAQATCSCPAPGICQHILLAGLYLQGSSPNALPDRTGPTEESIRAELSLITTEALRSWAGSTDYRKGVSLFEKNSLPPVIEYADTVIIRLNPSGIETRFVPGGGLGGMILPKLNDKRAAVATILALRKSLGLEIPQPSVQQSLVELSGTPRTKKEILDSACSVLEDAVAVGLTHASGVLVERLVTLAVSAKGAELPRVSLALKTVADEANSILQRQARADEDRLLMLIARVYALMDAIRSGTDQTTTELAGVSRGVYVDVPEIELAGVGAYTWQTGSGYVGLTVLFWAHQTKEFLSWSYARPEIQRVDARQRFFAEGPWEGAQSPRQVAASTLKLRNARRTAKGRLSSSTKTSALVLGPTTLESIDFGDRVFVTWLSLHKYVATRQPLGLRESNPLDMTVVLRPSAFGQRSFDPITQTFTWEIYDAANEPLTLSLPFRDWTKESIRILEELVPQSSWQFLVRVVQDDGLLVEPISILRAEKNDTPVFQLSFDPLGDYARQPGPDGVDRDDSEDVQVDEEETAGTAESLVIPNVALNRVLTELNEHLLAIAETGIQKGMATHQQWFSESTAEVHTLGLIALAKAMDTFANQRFSPAHILRMRYLTHLHSQAVSQCAIR